MWWIVLYIIYMFENNRTLHSYVLTDDLSSPANINSIINVLVITTEVSIYTKRFHKPRFYKDEVNL